MAKIVFKKHSRNNILLAFLIIVAFFLGSLLFLETYTPPENTTEVLKKLPPEIKKTVANPETLATSSASYRIPIILYHYVENVQDPKDKIRKSLAIPPAIFSLQIQTLKNDGYTFMTMGDVEDVIDGKRSLPQKPIVLTFDDGYRDFYTDVFPILKEYNAHAVTYIISGFINKPNYMFDYQIKDLITSGLVEIGGHTIDHPNLTRLSLDRMQQEITQSKSDLEKRFSIPVVSFAYPYGLFNISTIDTVRSAGYRSAVTTLPGIIVNDKDRFYLYRIRPGYRTGVFLLNFLTQNSFRAW